MSAEMQPVPFAQLLSWALAEHRSQDSVFGIPSSLFYVPRADRRFETRRPFGAPISTPFGPAAGPHTQLAQNLVAAWLCGGRFLELKTVQILDRLEIPRPCIAAPDQGYNVEWSQELTLDQSAREYAHAWALVHILPRALGFPLSDAAVFNQSVGYTLDGIRSPAVQRFLDRMADARELLEPVRATLAARFASLASVEIPDRISDSVTLSTMHGCPPEEIERIARHLLEERGLHVIVKLNPTLLGRDRIAEILRDRLGYHQIEVPAEVFEHDLRLDACLDLVSSLRRHAARCGRGFAVKLSNTLAVRNVGTGLSGDTVYMSGRALYPLTVTLFHALRGALGADLAVSYSGGADADSAPGLVAAGACPVTVATDLLKPGGYGRLRQYVDRLDQAMDEVGARSLDDFAANSSAALDRAADDAVFGQRYRKLAAAELPKISDPLPEFDCIAAPCVAACPACQDVPVYAAHLADGSPDAALAAILARNPVPAVTGHICTARCEARCTRTAIDRPVRIRDLKRFAVERGTAALGRGPTAGQRVAIVGGGPSGLSAATFLASSGIAVTLYEEGSRAGGMPGIAPAFRLPTSAVAEDVGRAEALGVTLRLGQRAPGVEELLTQGFSAVYVASGFPLDAPLPDVSGLDVAGVFGALTFLRLVAEGRPPALGARVLVVGGGNTAIDAARTALRLAPSVSVLYRRTRAELPADTDEVDDFLAEGGSLLKLVSPVGVASESRRLVGVDCVRNRLGDPGSDGRRRPTPMPETRFRIPADSLLVAVGQATDPQPLGNLLVREPSGAILADARSGATASPAVFAGGDVVRGPATIIEAVSDGRRAAQAICTYLDVPFRTPPLPPVSDPEVRVARARLARARRLPTREPARLPLDGRKSFALVTETLDEASARAEAERCLQCQLACDRCVEVCPNRANHAYRLEPVDARAPILDLATGAVVGEDRVRLTQSRQIVHISDLCNECGNCATFCAHEGRPFADKPRLFLARRLFEASAGAAVRLAGRALEGRSGDGVLWHVAEVSGGFEYADGAVTVRLSPALAVEKAQLLGVGTGSRSTAQAVRAAALLRGLRQSPIRELAENEEGAP